MANIDRTPEEQEARYRSLEEQCRKAQATQAAVDARAAAIEARERAAAHQPWSKYPGVLAGDIEGRKKAEEACSRSTVPQPPALKPGDFVTGNCPGPGVTANFDAQGAAVDPDGVIDPDWQPEALALLRVAKLPDGRGKR